MLESLWHHFDFGSVTSSILFALGLLLFLTFLCLVEELLQVILRGELLEQFEDRWHIIVPSSLVLGAPPLLPLLLSFNFAVLHGQALCQLGPACLECLLALSCQLSDLFLADVVGRHVDVILVGGLAAGDGCLGLVGKLLGDPSLRGCELSLLVLELSDLIADHGKQIKSDLATRICLNPRLNLLSRQCEPSLIRALSMVDRSSLEPV